jgi:hypothetical protein
VVERLNFYDFYGYLLPGFALVILLWIPFGLVDHWLPPSEIVSGVAALAVAYFLGFLIQAIGESAYPGKVKDSQLRLRYPSDLILDLEDGVFRREVKRTIEKRVKDQFGLNIDLDAEWTEEIGHARRNAFFLSRGNLMKTKMIVYAEQFQGLYALMLGLTVALGLGAVYLLGWAASAWRFVFIDQASVIICGLSILALVLVSAFAMGRANHTTVDRITLAILGVGLFAGGYLLGSYSGVSTDHAVRFIVLAALGTFGALRFYDRYRYFSLEFAKAIWNQFAVPAAEPD